MVSFAPALNRRPSGEKRTELTGSLGISAVMSRQHLFQARRAMRAFLAEAKPEKEAAE